MLDLSGFQESNPTSLTEDLVCGTVWQQFVQAWKKVFEW